MSPFKTHAEESANLTERLNPLLQSTVIRNVTIYFTVIRRYVADWNNNVGYLLLHDLLKDMEPVAGTGRSELVGQL